MVYGSISRQFILVNQTNAHILLIAHATVLVYESTLRQLMLVNQTNVHIVVITHDRYRNCKHMKPDHAGIITEISETKYSVTAFFAQFVVP